MIDTLKYTRELESAGLDPQQAEKIVRAQIDMITTSVATRGDLKVLEARMDVEFTEIRSQFKDVYRRFDDIDRKFEDIDRRFEDIERKFEDLDRRFDDVYRHLKDIQRQIEGTNEQLLKIEDRITLKLAGIGVVLLTLFTLINKLV